MSTDESGDVDYRSLAELRYALRRFQAFSEEAAAAAGLTPQQHQALLAIKGFADERGLSVGTLAERLMIRHNTATELVNRLERAGLVQRQADAADARRVSLHLMPEGERRLRALSAVHLAELRSVGPKLRRLIDVLPA